MVIHDSTVQDNSNILVLIYILNILTVKCRSPTVFRKYFMIKLKLELISITLFKVLGPVRSSVRVYSL